MKCVDDNSDLNSVIKIKMKNKNSLENLNKLTTLTRNSRNDCNRPVNQFRGVKKDVLQRQASLIVQAMTVSVIFIFF